MHVSSFAKMGSFLRSYIAQFPRLAGKVRLLEVGSKSYEGQRTYRDLIDDRDFSYTGLDLEPGINVDFVPAQGYIWTELVEEQFDVCISGQTFEHNPFFWVTMAEISRVLVPGGYACIIAPASQAVHRFPLDCWRFYPDSWAALCVLVDLEPVEIYFETDQMAMSVVDGHIRDSMLIARRSQERSEVAKQRLADIVRPFAGGPIEVKPIANKEGPCIADYRRTAPRAAKVRARLAHAINPDGPVSIFPEAP